ncbi:MULTISPECIES: helix-turn-helix domain-containing protein [unclassified Fusibacter]|uniref:helix-turn-helix domain-containing protein n=1 Tax=unclassified Fusibacter TaxID=2624464 RepID=UPI00101059CA|nr:MULTISPECIES: helix-turn-helix domain-containing protein [unclassified Fusibacter]MCK8058728.1 helix-turn-helix domain-containing protein [Fusibacter sp. A2]NPE21802.1 helix-turn-helix transcriptional regulator [Fusibacter sp. A1]RXV61374.1 transcriptional regulator [Fusibacter sp. A1]
MSKYLSSSAALSEVGKRLKAFRIDYPLSQQELADKAGISRRSITNMENGEDVQLTTLIKVLMALGLDQNLDMLVPDPTKRPSYHLNNKSIRVHRSRVGRRNKEAKTTFKWGDES